MPKETVINLQSHDTQAKKRGEDVLFFQHRKCPCGATQVDIQEIRDKGKGSQDSLRANLTCPLCRGYGYTWDEPIIIRSLINDVTTSNMKDLLSTGLAAPGDMTMNPAPLSMRNITISDFDKVIFPHRGGQPYDGDVVVRGQRKNQNWDLLSYRAAQVVGVAWLPDGADALTICVEGTDYTWSRLSDKLTWIPGGPNVPPVGTRVTVTYNCYYEWIVFVSPFVRVERNNRLGPRVLLKKKHLIGMA